MQAGSTRLALVSTDLDLADLCREVLRNFPEDRWEFFMTSTPSGEHPADVYLWDYKPEMNFSFSNASSDCQHLFLVSPELLHIFRACVNACGGIILLKPITRAVMRAFIGSVVSSRAQRSLNELTADRDEVLQCLLEATFRLQQYDQCRTNFLARVIHDFRAPLTAVGGFCGMLMDQQFGPLSEEQMEVVGSMLHSTRRLIQMASSMFQLTIKDRTDWELNLQSQDVRDCVKQAIHECLPLALEKSIKLSIDQVLPSGPLLIDSSQIEQLLVNLFDNACKFTPHDGRITVRGYLDFWDRRFLRNGYQGLERRTQNLRVPNCYRIDVTDTGVGIPAEYLDSIFEEYTQYSGSLDRSGGGLGLAICKTIAARHKGAIWAESGESGTTFSLVIPYGLDSVAARESF